MRARTLMAAMLTGGLLLSIGSCASDLGYYLIDALSEYLPDILEALQTSSA
ncbi:MAG: hypothetical protein AB1601_01220 [Planctomycetota bacterium]